MLWDLNLPSGEGGEVGFEKTRGVVQTMRVALRDECERKLGRRCPACRPVTLAASVADPRHVSSHPEMMRGFRDSNFWACREGSP